jgi:hypothetical protein
MFLSWNLEIMLENRERGGTEPEGRRPSRDAPVGRGKG